MSVRPEQFGAVYGQVSNEQKALNLQALNQAAGQGGKIILAGKLYVNQPVECFEGLEQTGVSLCGESMLESGLWLQTLSHYDAFVSLRGTSYFAMDNLSINSGNAADYGLVCARDESFAPAGKHTFRNVRSVQSSKASHLNHGSEDNAYIKCLFQMSPIGVIVTAHEVVDDVIEYGVNPVDWESPWAWSTSHHFFDCAFGDANYASRCGLLVARSVVNLFGGIIQAKRNVAEAYAIIDGTGQAAVFSGIHLDAALCGAGFKIGHYAPIEPIFETRLALNGHISITDGIGEHYIKARNLTSSVIGPLSVSGGLPNNGSIIELDETCRNVDFINCRYANGDPITILRV